MNINKNKINLSTKNTSNLVNYVATQLHNIFPDESISNDKEVISEIIFPSLERLEPIIFNVKGFQDETFNHFNSLQYCTFLYLLANQYWLTFKNNTMADRLFNLNRTLNGIDIFYTVKMPEIFFISHGQGTVLGNTSYGNRLVIFHNVTVGRIDDLKPTIGNNVVMYPGSVVTGNSKIGNNTVISANTVIHNKVVPDNVLVKTIGNKLEFFPLKEDYLSLYLK